MKKTCCQKEERKKERRKKEERKKEETSEKQDPAGVTGRVTRNAVPFARARAKLGGM